MKQKDRQSSTDTLYEVVCLESESERERRKTTASPALCLPQSGSQGSMIPSPPEDDEEEGKEGFPGLSPTGSNRQISKGSAVRGGGSGSLLEPPAWHSEGSSLRPGHRQ